MNNINNEEKVITNRFLYRKAGPDDDKRILNLYKASFNRDLSQHWWKWFNYNCPTGLNRTSLIEDCVTGELACSLSFLPIRLKYNDMEIKASLAVNGNTHPSYLKRGLFTEIEHYAFEREKEMDTPISLGMPNQKVFSIHTKVGWNVMCKLPFLVKHNCKARKNKCKNILLFDNNYDTFFMNNASRYSFIVVKNHQFINWRISHRPDKKYKIYIYEEGGELKGYVVLKHFKDHDGYHKSHILDIQAEDVDALTELIAAAETFATGSDELNLWTNIYNPYHSTFIDRGFYERESQDLLIIHFNCEEMEPLEKTSWWFCLADNDVY